MVDFIRIQGRLFRRDLFDADLHDETVQWIVQHFGLNGFIRRFPDPAQRTSGGVASRFFRCDDELPPASCCEDSRQTGFVAAETRLDCCGGLEGVPCDPCDEGETELCCGEESVCQDAGAVIDGEQPRIIPGRKVCWPDAENANTRQCECPPDAIPLPESTVYFRTPGKRFPLTMRSTTCVAEYIGPEVQAWLDELDEIRELIAADWILPAVFAKEPPVAGAGAAARIDALRKAVRELIDEGEADLKVFRLPDSSV